MDWILDNWTDESGNNITDESSNVIEFANINVIYINGLSVTEFEIVDNTVNRYRYVNCDVIENELITAYAYKDVRTDGCWIDESGKLTDENGECIDLFEILNITENENISNNLAKYITINDIQVIDEELITNDLIRDKYVDYLQITEAIDVSNQMIRWRYINNLEVISNVTVDVYLIKKHPVINYILTKYKE